MPEGQRFELCTINPVYVIGPSLDGHRNASNEIVRKLVDRELPGLPRLYFPLVDVRDVATAHVLAMTNEHAAGERFIVSAQSLWYTEIAAILRDIPYVLRTLEDYPDVTAPDETGRTFADNAGEFSEILSGGKG